MCVNPLDILLLAQVPDAQCLVTTAAAKDRLVSWMPHRCVASEVMHELSGLGHGLRIPHLDLLII